MPKGRPPLTEEVIRERIAAYCARHGVSERNADGFPNFPTGKRESPQHREWVVLYKTFHRMRARQRSVAVDDSQGRSCPICLTELDRHERTAGKPGLHPRCAEVLEFLSTLGPASLDRIRPHLAPDPPDPARRRKS